MRVRPLDIAIIGAGVAGGIVLGAWLAARCSLGPPADPAHIGGSHAPTQAWAPAPATRDGTHHGPDQLQTSLQRQGRSSARRSRRISACLARSLAIPPSALERCYGSDTASHDLPTTQTPIADRSRPWVTDALARLHQRSQDPEWSSTPRSVQPDTASPPVPAGPGAPAVRIRNAWKAGRHRGLTSRRWTHRPPPASDG